MTELLGNSEELKPSYNELVEFAEWAAQKQPDAVMIMCKHGLRFDNLDDPMQKLAFAFYTDLCEINSRVKNLFEEDE